MVQHLPMAFINGDYRKHRENVLYEREIGMLPATQPFVSNAVKRGLLNQQVQELRAQRKILDAQISDHMNEIFYLNGLSQEEVRKQSVKKRQTYVLPCPGDSCKGFVDGNSWECGTCSVNVCKDCHAAKTDDDAHVCNPTDVETAVMIKKECRSCPSCAIPIFKIDGCDQMYCVVCNTAFSWKTGLIEKNRIHNPHYYEYLRLGGGGAAPPREPGDVLCGGHPCMTALTSRLRNKTALRMSNDGIRLYQYFSLHEHIELVERPRYRDIHNNRDSFYHNLDLRMHFMMNKMTDTKFKTRLQNVEKTRRKKAKVFDVLDMFLNVASDLFRNWLNLEEGATAENTRQLVAELDSLTFYMETQFHIIRHQFNCMEIPLLDSDRWIVVNNARKLNYLL